jgi:hypothetical protein
MELVGGVTSMRFRSLIAGLLALLLAAAAIALARALDEISRDVGSASVGPGDARGSRPQLGLPRDEDG